VLHHAIDFYHDGRFGSWRFAFLSLFIDDAKTDQPKILLFPSQRLLDQQFEGRFRRFELVAFALQLLCPAQDLLHRVILAL
jgi:hypothetical protein